MTSVNRESPSTLAAGPATPTAHQLLKLHAIKPEQKKAIVQAASNWIVQTLHRQGLQSPVDALGDFANTLVMGAFVTLKRGEILRGCCGVLGKPMPLGVSVASAAQKTAQEDQRMAPISVSELNFLTMDVTLLGPFVKIEATGADRKEAVQVGKHGLMIQIGKQSGLLLPSVAVDRGWDAAQFLQAVCSKAGLPIGSWENTDATLYTFEGESFGGRLSDLIPVNLPVAIEPPISAAHLEEYARMAGQNIVAMVTGGTPSYVMPHLPDATVNAIVLSMQWGSGEGGTQNQRQGNALQVSFRPGVPLQSTLYQMCQQAANMFMQQRFSGQLQVGLSLGFDPALHGFGSRADLEGVDSSVRGIVISDPRHCGFCFQPEKSIDELRDVLRRALPIGSRDATVHSMQVISTMPHIMCVTIPTAVIATGARPAAVAGKFYPAEDAARRAMVGTMFKGDEPEKSSPLAIMVPHAGIKYCGRVAANVWRRLESPESRTLIVISPKHTGNGVNWAVCPFDSWRISNTTSIAGESELAKKIAAAVTPIELDAAAHQQEHGIEVQLPLLEKIAPGCKVVGLALNGGSWEDIQLAANEFAEMLKTLPELPLLVISSDMNHYAPEAENRRRDRLALDAMATGDPKRLIDTCQENEISMCGLVPAAFVMETLRRLGHEFHVTEVDYTTSAETTGDKSAVVGYAGALFTKA